MGAAAEPSASRAPAAQPRAPTGAQELTVLAPRGERSNAFPGAWMLLVVNG